MQKDNQLTTINQFLNSLVTYLKDKTPRNTGALANSYRGDADINGIEIYGLDYFKFVEEGVNGTEKSWGSPYSFSNKMPPASSFASYGNNQYAIARYVFKNGIKPKQIITPTLDKQLDEFGNKFIEAIWNDFAEEEKDKKNVDKK